MHLHQKFNKEDLEVSQSIVRLFIVTRDWEKNRQIFILKVRCHQKLGQMLAVIWSVFCDFNVMWVAFFQR